MVVDERLPNKVRYNRHPRRKNNDVVAAMHAMYRTGKSLAEIGRTYRKTRQAVYDVFRSRGYELRKKNLAGLTVIDGIKFTIMKGGYLRGTKDGRRVTAQRYVWEKHNGPVDDRYVIHHADGDRLNNEISNLELVPYFEMSSRFNPTGRNQFSKKHDGQTDKKTKKRAHVQDTL